MSCKLIDAKNFYKVIEDKYKFAIGDARKAYSDVLDTICDFLEVAPKCDDTGRWVNAFINGVHHYRCTNCGSYIEATWTANVTNFNFCPNCGKPMLPAKDIS